MYRTRSNPRNKLVHSQLLVLTLCIAFVASGVAFTACFETCASIIVAFALARAVEEAKAEVADILLALGDAGIVVHDSEADKDI